MISEEEQRMARLGTFGASLRPDLVEAAYSLLKDAPRDALSESHRYLRMPFELVLQEDLGKIANDIAKSWIADAFNAKHIAMAFNKTSWREKDIFSICTSVRFKPEPYPNDKWEPVGGGLASDEKHQTMIVLVALEDLSPQNGFFRKLSKGETLYVWPSDRVFFPSTGGGLAIYIAVGFTADSS